MPQHGITALVDFIEPFEAKKAFTKLAYSQFKSAPLYLEWAPENVFIKSSEKIDSDKNTIAAQSDDVQDEIEASTTPVPVSKEPGSNNQDVQEQDETELEEPENDTTLFVKNLNFKTTEDSLKAVRIHSAYINITFVYFFLLNFMSHYNYYFFRSIFPRLGKYTVCLLQKRKIRKILASFFQWVMASCNIIKRNTLMKLLRICKLLLWMESLSN